MGKNLRQAILFFAGAMLATSVAGAFEKEIMPPAVYDVLPKSVYVPVGFDTNDNSQVVIEGQFENSCYRPGVTDVKIDSVNKTIQVYNKAQKYMADICLMVIVDYKKEINLGVLDNPGEYSILFSDDTGNMNNLGSIKVDRATTSTADNYLYAPIKEARYVKTDAHKNGYVEVTGSYTNSCMKLDRFEVTRASSTVIQVLPIVTVEERSDCMLMKDNPIDFVGRVSLEGYGSGRVLIHIRSLNGQAINLIEKL